MKKANTLLVLAILLSYQLSYSQSQVKRQFQDDTFAETTVVIKDDASTNDLDVLNDHFDMDDVGMGQIIRITTEKDPIPVAVKEKTPAPVVEKAPVIQKVALVQAPPTIQKEAVAGAPAQPQQRSVRSSGSAKPAKNRAYIGKSKSKRLKNPKRKIKKRKSTKCYRF